MTDGPAGGGALRRVEELLSGQEGISEARGTALTGTILIHYDPDRVDIWTSLERAAASIGASAPAPEEERTNTEKRSDGFSDRFSELFESIARPFQAEGRQNGGSSRAGTDRMAIVPWALLALGVKKLLTERPLPSVPYYLFLWWSFQSYYYIYEGPRRREPLVKSTSGGRSVVSG